MLHAAAVHHPSFFKQKKGYSSSACLNATKVVRCKKVLISPSIRARTPGLTPHPSEEMKHSTSKMTMTNGYLWVYMSYCCIRGQEMKDQAN
jgi:hypothetical protein